MKRIEHEATKGQRHTVGRGKFQLLVRWEVYDECLQIELFHWHGSEGEAKCLAVAAALNSQEWDD
jgi:hypothetical protein